MPQLLLFSHQFDQVIANGITINDDPGFFPGRTQGNLRIGTVLTVINSTSTTPITGTFNNLADGSIISANGGNFEVSCSGADWNDLTLTILPSHNRIGKLWWFGLISLPVSAAIGG
jgi:hypothetical protein